MTALLSRPDRPTSTEAAARRVRVRALVRSDADAFVAAVKASRPLHGAWVRPPDSVEKFKDRLPRRGGAANRVALVAIRASDGALLGAFNLSEIVRGPLQQAYLGYYAFTPHAGHGYMREAMQLVLRHAFRILKLHRMEANIQPDNAPSIALVSATGFSKEGFSLRYLKIGGRWRDHERWAINSDAWEEQLHRTPARNG